MKKLYSQAGQDKWVIEILKEKMNGFFLDIGAFDGVNISNTYALEKDFDWNGICIEADPETFKLLSEARSCKCVNQAISNEEGFFNFKRAGAGGEINKNGDCVVECKTLRSLLKEHNVPKLIDYISLDIEGHEFNALQEFPFDEYEFVLLTVEHNLYIGNDTNKKNIKSILEKNGYVIFKENVCNIGNDPFEDWYINPKYIIL